VDDNFNEFNQNQQSIDIKVILYKFLRYWYLFVLTIGLALVIAFLFNKYSRPIYEVETTILVKERNEGGIDPQAMIGLGLYNNFQNLQNEIGIISSYTLVYRAVLKAGFEISYFGMDRFSTIELYKQSPFTVVFDTAFPQPVNMRFNLTILSPQTFRLVANTENVDFYDFAKRDKVPEKYRNIHIDNTYSFGKEIENPDFKFKVILNQNFNKNAEVNPDYYFIFNDYNSLIGEFRSLTVEPINKEASILGLKIRGRNSAKLVDFLNALNK